MLPGKTLVDEKIFLIMSHRVAEVHVNDLPTMTLELIDYNLIVVHESTAKLEAKVVAS